MFRQPRENINEKYVINKWNIEKKTKKVIVSVKRGSKGQILIDDALLSKLPPNMKIDAQGRLVKLTRIVNEDGTIVEVEEVVETKVVG